MFVLVCEMSEKSLLLARNDQNHNDSVGHSRILRQTPPESHPHPLTTHSVACARSPEQRYNRYPPSPSFPSSHICTGRRAQRCIACVCLCICVYTFEGIEGYFVVPGWLDVLSKYRGRPQDVRDVSGWFCMVLWSRSEGFGD